MREDNLPSSAVSVLTALFFAFVLALSFLWEPSPERLLWQGIFIAMVIDGLRPFLGKFKNGVVNAVSAVAYFVPRVLVVAMILVWLFNRVPELISTRCHTADGRSPFMQAMPFALFS